MQLASKLLTVGWSACALVLPPLLAQAAPSTSELIPDRAAVAIEVLKPSPILETLLSPAFSARLKALPAYDALISGPKLQDLRNGVQWLETAQKTNWQSIVRSVTRENAALAFGEGGRYLVVLTGNDPDMLRGVHDFALQAARSEAEKRGQSDQVRSMEYAGLTGWTFNGKEAHAVVGNQLLAASDAQVLKAAVDLRDSQGVGSLAGRADYKAARQAVGQSAIAMVFVDLEKLRLAPWFNALLDPQKQNPLASLLFAEVPEVLKTAHWLALGAYAEPGGLSLRAFSDAKVGTNTPAAFARVAPGMAGLATTLEVPRQTAVLNLYRDLAGFYAAKDALFPERTSGLIFFENMMGIFFSGRNLTDEVLSELEPQVQLVVARQEYDPSIGTPEPRYPAFALVFKLRHPDKFGEVLEEAWQKALGLVNFTRGQKAQPGLILDKVEHEGTRITVAQFSAKEVEDRTRLDQRFNFRPSLAVAKGHAILSSTDQLARDLLNALGKVPAAGTTAAGRGHTWLQVGGNELSEAFRGNRMAMVRDNMLKEGKSQPEAEAAIDNLIALVKWFNQATLRTGDLRPGQTAELLLSFSKP